MINFGEYGNGGSGNGNYAGRQGGSGSGGNGGYGGGNGGRQGSFSGSGNTSRQGGSGYGGNGGKQGGSGAPASLPEGYLEGGYYSDEGKERLKKEFIVAYPKEIARQLEYDGGKDANKRSQIRKFYEYLLRVEDKMDRLGNDFSMVEADLADLLPHVNYAGGRKVVSRLFIQFIEKNVTAVKDAKDLRAFVKHFEAVIAYTKKD